MPGVSGATGAKLTISLSTKVSPSTLALLASASLSDDAAGEASIEFEKRTTMRTPLLTSTAFGVGKVSSTDSGAVKRMMRIASVALWPSAVVTRATIGMDAV